MFSTIFCDSLDDENDIYFPSRVSSCIFRSLKWKPNLVDVSLDDAYRGSTRKCIGEHFLVSKNRFFLLKLIYRSLYPFCFLLQSTSYSYLVLKQKTKPLLSLNLLNMNDNYKRIRHHELLNVCFRWTLLEWTVLVISRNEKTLPWRN